MSPQNSDSVSSEFRPVLQELNAPAHMGLAEILQTCCSNHKSGQLTFHSGESSGYIYLQHGRVIHAVCGLAEGEEAVYRMLLWPEGWFSLDSEVLPHQKTIDLTLEQLLFEGARRADILAGGAELTPTVVTAEPLTKTRLTKQSQPRLTIILPDQRPQIFDLKAEYTHVGRASENEIALPDASISNRHCMFIQSGSDIFLRDLNSSNGTSVNGESITEVLLRPGDLIRVGLVQMKFESGVRRPKLTNTNAGTLWRCPGAGACAPGLPGHDQDSAALASSGTGRRGQDRQRFREGRVGHQLRQPGQARSTVEKPPVRSHCRRRDPAGTHSCGGRLSLLREVRALGSRARDARQRFSRIYWLRSYVFSGPACGSAGALPRA